jgi:hypothetical protein
MVAISLSGRCQQTTRCNIVCIILLKSLYVSKGQCCVQGCLHVVLQRVPAQSYKTVAGQTLCIAISS